MHEKFNEDFAETLEVEREEITPGYVLEESEMWDSMTIVTTIALIDEHYGKSVDGEKLANCKTVGAIYKLIKES